MFKNLILMLFVLPVITYADNYNIKMTLSEQEKSTMQQNVEKLFNIKRGHHVSFEHLLYDNDKLFIDRHRVNTRPAYNHYRDFLNQHDSIIAFLNMNYKIHKIEIEKPVCFPETCDHHFQYIMKNERDFQGYLPNEIKVKGKFSHTTKNKPYISELIITK